MYERRIDSIISPRELLSIDEQLRQPDADALVARGMAAARRGDHPATEMIVYKKMTREGAAKIFNWGGADSIPLVDAFATDYPQKVVSIVCGFQISQMEASAAEMSGKPVSPTKLSVAEYYIAQKENALFFQGSAPHKIEGIESITGAQTYPVPTVDGHTKWADKTALQVLADIQAAWQLVNFQDNYHATAAWFNTGMMAQLYRMLDTTKDSRTIMEFILEQGWFPAGIFRTGKATAAKFGVFQNTPDVLEYGLPLDVKPSDPWRVNGFVEEIDLHERYAGPCVYRPLGICVASGIA